MSYIKKLYYQRERIFFELLVVFRLHIQIVYGGKYFIVSLKQKKPKKAMDLGKIVQDVIKATNLAQSCTKIYRSLLEGASPCNCSVRACTDYF